MPVDRCPRCQAPTRVGVHFGTQCGHRLTPLIAGDLLAFRFHSRQLRRRDGLLRTGLSP